MCTVTYIPYRQGFILTHNRDEAPTRSPERISCVQSEGDTLYFPQDTKAGGAWVVTSRSGRTACVLNGAFVKHRHQPPYRRSRGLVMLDFFEQRPDDFMERYDLTGIEPFTFLFFEPRRVIELRWDGEYRHMKILPADRPHFWCSATLYPPDMQVRREAVFLRWLEQHRDELARSSGQVPAAIRKLHRTGSVGDPENDYVMNRDNRVRTVSITQVIAGGPQVRMRYTELSAGLPDVKQFRLKEKIFT